MWNDALRVSQMLFCVGWKAREGHGPEEGDESFELFTRWKPPQALQMKGMWARADGGGFCICEASSAEYPTAWQAGSSVWWRPQRD